MHEAVHIQGEVFCCTDFSLSSEVFRACIRQLREAYERIIRNVVTKPFSTLYSAAQISAWVEIISD